MDKCDILFTSLRGKEKDSTEEEGITQPLPPVRLILIYVHRPKGQGTHFFLFCSSQLECHTGHPGSFLQYQCTSVYN